MIVVDSSAWLEVFTVGPLADRCRAWVEGGETVLVPTVVLYEVYKVVCRERSEQDALGAVARLRRQEVVPLSPYIALEAADASLRHDLPMADAVVYATAQVNDAALVTCDRHFANLPGVEYIDPMRPGE
jgi:predicted nucleic acid-binding protein